MNIKLFIGTEQADFNEAFNVMFSIGDIRNLSYGNNNKSYTLNIPLTKTNKRLLKYVHQADVRSEPSSMARLYLGDMLVICGKLKVLSTTNYAKVLIDSDEWIDTLKGKKLSELDLSADDHDLTQANIESSWTASYPLYRYPMINYGGLMSGEYGSLARWLPGDFVPMLSIASLITKILEPHTISSSWLTSAYIKDLFILGAEKIAANTFIQNKQLDVSVANDTDNQNTESIPATTSGNSMINFDKVTLSVETTDEGADWSNHTYTVPEDGSYRFSTALTLANNAPSQADFTITNEEVTVRIVSVRGAATTVLATVSAAAYSVAELIENITYTLTTDYFHLEAGDEVSVLIYVNCSVDNGGATAHDLIVGVKSGSTFENIWLNNNRYAGENKAISLEDYLPDMTQAEFLTQIRDIFNLRLFKDRSRNVIYLEPWDQLLSSTVVDITEYIDFTSEDAEMISQHYNEDISLRWSNDTSDEMYNEYLKNNADGPGSKDIALISEFSIPGAVDKRHPFSGILTGPHEVIGEWGVQIPKIWEDIPEWPYLTYKRKVGHNTRLVHWDGMTAGFTWYFDADTKNTYPKISAVSWDTIYTNYLMKFYHYIDRGKILTFKMRVKPDFLTQFFTVVNTAASEGFRPTYKINKRRVNGASVRNDEMYFFLQKITTNGIIAECEFIPRV